METKILKPGQGPKINVIGDHQTVRLTGEDTDGKFALIESNNPPGVGVPPHRHANEDEMFHVVEGEMTFTVGDETVLALAGTTVFLPRNVLHSFMTSGTTATKAMIMVFPAGCEKMFAELGQLPEGPPEMQKVLEICGRYGITFEL
jgi:quercetin dioxygenase-like cupin family protein